MLSLNGCFDVLGRPWFRRCVLGYVLAWDVHVLFCHLFQPCGQHGPCLICTFWVKDIRPGGVLDCLS